MNICQSLVAAFNSLEICERLFVLGILGASRMRSQQGFQVVLQLIVFPLIFLSRIFFPVNNVPMWLEVISKANPLTYGVEPSVSSS